MEAVLPLKIRPAGRSSNLGSAVMLCHSLAHFWRDTSPLLLTVICPREEILAACRALAETPPNIVLRFVPETELVPALDDNPALPGWMRQQVLKLAAFALVQSDFYLCLDADVLCIKPIKTGVLLPGGKALTHYGARERHADWWGNSAALLKVEPHLDRPGMRAVSPAVLSRRIVERLCSALSPADTDLSWRALIQTGKGLGSGWTEYTLYNLFAENAGLMDTYHVSYKESRALDRELISGRSVWSRQEFAGWNSAFLSDAQDRGLFVVLQSSAHLPLAEIWTSVRRQFGFSGPSSLPSFDD
jgi:hypothetical protein